MKKLYLFFAGIILLQGVYAQRAIDWKSDLDYLGKELSEKHYNFFTVKTSEELLNGLENIKSNTKYFSNLEVALKTQQLIASFGDSHTLLGYSSLLDRNQLLPLQLYWFSDGLFIISTTPENADILGYRITSINGFPIETVVDNLSSLITVDNPATLKNKTPQLLPSVQILDFLWLTDSEEVELGLQDLAGKEIIKIIKPTVMNRYNRQRCKIDSVALCYKNEDAYFTDAYFSDTKVYYLQYNKCTSKESELKYGDKNRAESLPSFIEFEDRVFKTLESKSIDKIVFDIRFNTGGSSEQGTLFIEKLAKYLKNNPEKKLYVILGRHTFSSAIINAMDFKRLTNAVFVGEETWGKPNHFGDVKTFQLPSSGLYVQYSTKYFKHATEDINTIKPDVLKETSFSDFTKGIDPAFEWIKEQ